MGEMISWVGQVSPCMVWNIPGMLRLPESAWELCSPQSSRALLSAAFQPQPYLWPQLWGSALVGFSQRLLITYRMFLFAQAMKSHKQPTPSLAFAEHQLLDPSPRQSWSNPALSSSALDPAVQRERALHVADMPWKAARLWRWD